MTNTSHTTGLWIIDRQSPHSPICVKPVGGRVVCDIEGTDAEAEANARLIAAAPDLLAACEYALSVHGDADCIGPDEHCLHCQLKAAIFRATPFTEADQQERAREWDETPDGPEVDNAA